jgi:hypothetical protein
MTTAVETDTTLLTLVPTTIIQTAINPNKTALTMSFVVLKITNVLLAVRPY